jgi:hypothetical protein
MNTRQARAIKSAENILGFLKITKPLTPRLESARADLEVALERFKETSQRQHNAVTSRFADSAHARSLGRQLRVKHLVPISRRGKLLLKGLPGIEESLRVPTARAHADELLQAAEQIFNAVRLHAEPFYEDKFPRSFLRELEQAAKALHKAITTPDTFRSRSARSTLDLREEIRHVRSICASIDGLMRAEFYGEPTAVRYWEERKRIPGRIGRPKGKKAAPRAD